MGSGKSKPKIPNNPFEVQKYQREQYDIEYKNAEKEERRQKKNAEKAMRQQQKLDALKVPNAPHVPKRPEAGYGEIDYDMEAKRRMQDQLARDGQTFVLNQLMLSVQLFENYEKEMWEAVERNRKQENDETSKIEKYCKIVILPDRLHEAIDRRVKFQSRHGPNKTQVSPLNTQTLYVVHENIEINNPGERSDYSILTDAPIYKMEIDVPTNEQDHHIGYVRLKTTETIRKSSDPPSVSASNSEADSDQESEEELDVVKLNTKYRDSIMIMSKSAKLQQRERLTNGFRSHRNSVVQMPEPNGHARRVSMSSSSTPSTEYDYAYITALNTRQPLSVMQSIIGSHEPFSATTLPGMCISNIPVASSCGSDDYHESDDEEAVYEVKQYLNSKSFLAYFLRLFRDTLASDLGISKAQIDDATWKGSVIYSKPWEIIPAIACPWPNEAFEWMHRQREIKENPITRQKFQWPTKVMVNKVVSFGCLVIPLGFAPKSGVNPHRELEWKMVFPEAERYLESCLTSAQIKVYVITKALLQTFVEPYLDTKRNMFTSEHLRTHLFWQCENNYAAWPEDYLGEALIRFLNALLERIKRQRLPDYFLPQRNLFENIPERIMVDLHKLIFRITENPLMYLLIAIRNLQFHSNYGVPLDFLKLYSTVTIDNPLKIINPNFRVAEDDSEKAVSSGDILDSDEEAGPDAMGAIGYYQKADRNVKVKRRKTRKVRFMEEKLNQQLEKQARKESVESIDVRFPAIKYMEQLRRVIIYEQFINHFIAMAHYSTTFRAYNQAIIYLKQGLRLCSLLRDDDRVEQASHYMLKLEALHINVLMERNRDSVTKPQLPRRESNRELSNKTKFRVKAPRMNKLDHDPYSNIELARRKENTEPTNSKINTLRSKPELPKLSREEAMTIRNQIITNIQIHSAPEHPPMSPTNGIVYMTPETPRKPLESVNFFSDDVFSDDEDVKVKTPVTVRKANGIQTIQLRPIDSGLLRVKGKREMSGSDTDDFITAL